MSVQSITEVVGVKIPREKFLQMLTVDKFKTAGNYSFDFVPQRICESILSFGDVEDEDMREEIIQNKGIFNDYDDFLGSLKFFCDCLPQIEIENGIKVYSTTHDIDEDQPFVIGVNVMIFGGPSCDGGPFVDNKKSENSIEESILELKTAEEKMLDFIRRYELKNAKVKLYYIQGHCYCCD